MPNANDLEKIEKMRPAEVNTVSDPKLQAVLAELTAEADRLEAKIEAEVAKTARPIPRPYVSIDIETTGLNPETCQILEIGAVLDDWNSPISELKKFHCYVVHETTVGEDYALNMNKAILARIANRHEPENTQYLFLSPGQVAVEFNGWLMGCGLIGTTDAVADTVLPAGKNFASFDRQFLKQLPGFENIKFHHRTIDPAMLFWNPEIDEVPPSSKQCMERAGIPGEVAHTAIADAEAVISEVRFATLLRKLIFTLAEVRLDGGSVYIQPLIPANANDTISRRQRVAAELLCYLKDNEGARPDHTPSPAVAEVLAKTLEELRKEG